LEQPPKHVAERNLLAHSHFAFRSVSEKDRDMLQKIFALRYEVYCQEYKFLSADKYPHGVEFDEYDNCSTHFAATSPDNELAGALRLIQPRADQKFPFEIYCKSLYETIKFPPRHECGEVSRLVVHKHYRRRRNDSHEGVPRSFTLNRVPITLVEELPSPCERRGNSPEILLGLYRQMYHYSLEAEVRYWYAAMERSLARVLKGLGFTFNPIGLESEYYGVVRPYMADLRELERSLGIQNPELLAWFRHRENTH